MRSLWQDLRYAFRTLSKSRGFTAVAVLTLALGVGANTAVFSVVNAVILRKLSFPNPGRLVTLWETNPHRDNQLNVVSPANFVDWQSQNSVFEQMAAYSDERTTLAGAGDPEEVAVEITSPNFFSVLGVHPALGRSFAGNEGDVGNNHVVVLSQGFWRRKLGSDPKVMGQTIQLNGDRYTVIGVMPSDFQFFIKLFSFSDRPAEVWLPHTFSNNQRASPTGRSWRVIARLKSGIALSQAQTELDTIASRLEMQYPEADKGWGISLVPLREQFVGEIGTTLWILLGAVGFVLLIGCANVANLLLARATSRQGELAIRSALGASGRRLALQLLTEGFLLAGTGGGIGLLFASWGMDALLSLMPSDLLGFQKVSIDFRVLAFTFATSLLTALLFGLAPVIQASQLDLNQAVKQGGRTQSAGMLGWSLRDLLVIGELALTFVLLVGSSLMIRSFSRIVAVDPGFNVKHLLTARISLPTVKYPEERQWITFFERALQRIRAVPGVQNASAVDAIPLVAGGSATSMEIIGRPAPPPGQYLITDVRVVDREYFHTMGIPMLQGRNFTEKEAAEASHVVIINQAMARMYFPKEDPLGKQVVIAMKEKNSPNEVIGVVGDTHYGGLDVQPQPMSYWPPSELARNSMTLVVRTSTEPQILSIAIADQVHALDPDQPVADVRAMEALVSTSLGRSRFSTALLTVFAVLAVVLAAGGMYAIISYVVSQGTHEIGIRMALGAQRAEVMRMVLRGGAKLIAIGVSIGIVAALALTRALSSLLFDVEPTDLPTFAIVAIVLIVVALLSCYVPARRATLIDPSQALRQE